MIFKSTNKSEMKKLVKIEAKKILATANIKGGSIGLQSSFSNDTGIVTGGVDPTCNKSTGYVVADNWRDYIDL